MIDHPRDLASYFPSARIIGQAAGACSCSPIGRPDMTPFGFCSRPSSSLSLRLVSTSYERRSGTARVL
jgi:hypothetical protein